MIVIESDIKKENDSPFCEHCINKQAEKIANMLGKEEEDKQKTYKQIEDPKEELIKQQQKEIDSLKDILYQHNELLKKISERLK